MRQEPARLLLNDFWQVNERYSREVREYADRLVIGVSQRLAEIDRYLSEAALNWQLERMGVVDRNILRIGAWELLYAGDVPAPVAIDEAIEIARLYGSEDSPGFVNGILDRVRQLSEKKKAPEGG